MHAYAHTHTHIQCNCVTRIETSKMNEINRNYNKRAYICQNVQGQNDQSAVTFFTQTHIYTYICIHMLTMYRRREIKQLRKKKTDVNESETTIRLNFQSHRWHGVCAREHAFLSEIYAKHYYFPALKPVSLFFVLSLRIRRAIYCLRLANCACVYTFGRSTIQRKLMIYHCEHYARTIEYQV